MLGLKAKIIACASIVGAFILSVAGLVLRHKVELHRVGKKHDEEIKKIYENNAERKKIIENLGKGDSIQRYNTSLDVVSKLCERTKRAD